MFEQITAEWDERIVLSLETPLQNANICIDRKGFGGVLQRDALLGAEKLLVYVRMSLNLNAARIAILHLFSNVV